MSSKPRPPNHLIGQKFNRLKILKLRRDKSYVKPLYKAYCLCNCGNKKWIHLPSIRAGRVISCGCRKKEAYLENSGQNSWQFTGYKEIPGKYFTDLKRRALEKNFKVNINIKYLWRLFIRQKRKCKLSGESIYFGYSNRSNCETTASLDRIDNDKGYIKGNVQWVHKKINVMRNTLTVNQFIIWSQKVVKTYKKRIQK